MIVGRKNVACSSQKVLRVVGERVYIMVCVLKLSVLRNRREAPAAYHAQTPNVSLVWIQDTRGEKRDE
jgi:hypothetical protein